MITRIFKPYNKGYYFIFSSVIGLLVLNVTYLVLNKCSDPLYYLITVLLIGLLSFGILLLQNKINQERMETIEHLNKLYKGLIKDSMELMNIKQEIMDKNKSKN